MLKKQFSHLTINTRPLAEATIYMLSRLAFFILVLTIPVMIGVGIASAQKSTTGESIPKLSQRLTILQKYRDNLEKLQKIDNAQLKKVLDKSLFVFDEAINDGLFCVSENDTSLRENCSGNLKQAYNRALKAYRLSKYHAILAGKPTTCVKADLGVQTHLKARGINPKFNASTNTNPKETGVTAPKRVFLCGGNLNKAGNVQIKWRVKDYSGTLLRITEDDKKKLGLTESPVGLSDRPQVKTVEKELGL